ncbi:myb protein-related [Anaeramoeba flamelloides]|uniref:Myb protein-related n=1 Tax=Anaeramoeba flamelloides TaxID=1746091 RepID=A0ABQ8XJI6_9EUKA|nr:myb protein-related [Anaeramoeba flamelloides]
MMKMLQTFKNNNSLLEIALKEDGILKEAVKSIGDHSWSHISCLVPGRNSKQCRERWRNQLNPNINRSPISLEEEELLIQKQSELGNKWSQIAVFFDARPDNMLKNAWHSLCNQRGLKPSKQSKKIFEHGRLKGTKKRQKKNIKKNQNWQGKERKPKKNQNKKKIFQKKEISKKRLYNTKKRKTRKRIIIKTLNNQKIKNIQKLRKTVKQENCFQNIKKNNTLVNGLQYKNDLKNNNIEPNLNFEKKIVSGLDFDLKESLVFFDMEMERNSKQPTLTSPYSTNSTTATTTKKSSESELGYGKIKDTPQQISKNNLKSNNKKAHITNFQTLNHENHFLENKLNYDQNDQFNYENDENFNLESYDNLIDNSDYELNPIFEEIINQDNIYNNDTQVESPDPELLEWSNDLFNMKNEEFSNSYFF